MNAKDRANEAIDRERRILNLVIQAAADKLDETDSKTADVLGIQWGRFCRFLDEDEGADFVEGETEPGILKVAMRGITSQSGPTIGEDDRQALDFQYDRTLSKLMKTQPAGGVR